jgi:hypothetical protein
MNKEEKPKALRIRRPGYAEVFKLADRQLLKSGGLHERPRSILRERGEKAEKKAQGAQELSTDDTDCTDVSATRAGRARPSARACGGTARRMRICQLWPYRLCGLCAPQPAPAVLLGRGFCL